MLDIKWIRENLNEAIERLNTRGGDFSYLKEVVSKDEERRNLISTVEKLKGERNTKSKEIGLLAKKGQDVETIKDVVRQIGEQIKIDDEKIAELDAFILEKLLITPNIQSKQTPVGLDEKDNVLIKDWGTPKEFSFPDRKSVV